MSYEERIREYWKDKKLHSFSHYDFIQIGIDADGVIFKLRAELESSLANVKLLEESLRMTGGDGDRILELENALSIVENDLRLHAEGIGL